MPWRALALGAVCAIVLWSRVFVSFDPIRLKVVKEAQAAVQGQVQVAVPAEPRLRRLEAPVVLITKLRNTGPSAITLALAMDEGRIATVTLGPHDDRRIDLVIPNNRTIRGGETLTFTPTASPAATGWSLEYLEIANRHGSSRSVFPFFIVPREIKDYEPPGPLLIAIVTIAIVFFIARGDATPATRRRAIVQHVLTAIVVLIFVAFVASGIVSPFTLLLSPRAFLLCAAALAWPGMVRAYRDVRERMAARSARQADAFDAVAVAAVVGLFYVMVAQSLLPGFDGKYSGFVRFGRNFVDRVPFLQERPDLRRDLFVASDTGYDGQFVYYIAFDPFLRRLKDPHFYRDVVDAPPYRYGRVGFSVLTKLFSGDRAERYPETMVWMILGATMIGAFLVARIAQEHGHSALWGLCYMLVPGFLQSLHGALPEPIAAIGLLGGYWLLLRGRAAWAAVLLAASLLLRETGVLFVVALVGWKLWDGDKDMRHGRWRDAALIACAVLPLIAWRSYVAWRLFPDFGWQGLFFDPQNLGVPFKGFIDLWRVIRRGEYFPDAPTVALGGTYYPPLLILALIVSLYLLWQRRDGLAAAIMLYACLAVSLNYTAIWAHVANGERGTYELFLLLIVAAATTPTIARLRTLRVALAAVLVCLFLYQWFVSSDAMLVQYVVLSS